MKSPRYADKANLGNCKGPNFANKTYFKKELGLSRVIHKKITKKILAQNQTQNVNK
jgi:hypothetical protein